MATPTERIEAAKRGSRVLRKLATALDLWGPSATPENRAAGLEAGPVQIMWRTAAAGLQLEHFDDLLSFRLRRGRQGAQEQAPPSSLTYSIPVTDPAAVTDRQVGDKLVVSFTSLAEAYLTESAPGTDALWGNTWSGYVSSLQLTYQPTGAGRPPQPILTVNAVGPKARAAQASVHTSSPLYPLPYTGVSELDDRRSRIVYATQESAFQGDYTLYDSLDSFAFDSQFWVIPLVEDSVNLLQILEDYAGDVGATLIESLRKSDSIDWEHMRARASKTPLLVLTPDEVAATATWDQSLAGLVNRYTVEYGLAEARGKLTVEDTESIAAFGEYAASRSTRLWKQADAQQLAGMILGRNSRPRWGIQQVDVDLLDLALPKAKASLLLGHAEHGSLIELVGLPSTAPAARNYFIEGTEITLTQHDWRMSVFVSDAEQTGAPLTWEEVPAHLTWADVEDDRTWLRAAGWFVPLPEQQRWSDVPSNLLWASLAASGRYAGTDYDARVPTWTSYPHNP